MKKKYRIKKWVKETITIIILLGAAITLFMLIAKENEVFVKNCVAAGNSELVCKRAR